MTGTLSSNCSVALVIKRCNGCCRITLENPKPDRPLRYHLALDAILAGFQYTRLPREWTFPLCDGPINLPRVRCCAAVVAGSAPPEPVTTMRKLPCGAAQLAQLSPQLWRRRWSVRYLSRLAVRWTPGFAPSWSHGSVTTSVECGYIPINVPEHHAMPSTLWPTPLGTTLLSQQGHTVRGPQRVDDSLLMS